MTETDPRTAGNPLLRIAGVGIALGIGFMAGSMQAFTRDAEGFDFHISVFTVLAFVIGVLIGVGYWRVVMRMIAPGNSPKPTGRFITFSALLLVATLGSYVYRLRFVPQGNVRDVAEGLVLAFLVVGMVALAMWRVIRFLEAQDKEPPGRQHDQS